MDACSIDAIVTDPPYHLTTSKKGGTGEASVNLESGRARITTGFMGKAWDGGDIAHQTALWQAALRIAKPGAYLLAFGGTRTYHRLAVAIEDAGWEIRDTVMWVYGSGFPKSHNGPWGGTALKPAWEPICVARKPLIGTVEENWRKHGAGALNIDACRIEHLSEEDRLAAFPAGRCTSRGSGTLAGGGQRKGERTEFQTYADRGATNFSATPGPRGGDALGRWPANLIHDGSEEVVALFPSGAAAPVYRRGSDKFRTTYGAFAGNVDEKGSTFQGDSGSAARFFYCTKADRHDREDGLRHFEPKRDADRVKSDGPGGDNPRNRSNRSNRNYHPTVKPTDLMRYLCRLVTPKGGTVLDPFMGSGSTLKAAELEGFSAVGIEIDPEYCEIARRRIASDAPLFAEVK